MIDVRSKFPMIRTVAHTYGMCIVYINICKFKKYSTYVNTTAVSSGGLRPNSSLQAVCDTPIARISGCVRVLKKDIGRRLPLVLATVCSTYEGQQGDIFQRRSVFNDSIFNHSAHGNRKSALRQH